MVIYKKQNPLAGKWVPPVVLDGPCEVGDRGVDPAGQGVKLQPNGVVATIRGFSAVDLVIEDEAARVSDETYLAIRPMLVVSGDRLILMSTPFGKRGHFFDAWANGGDAWERTEITAGQCPRISDHFLEQERTALGEWRFRQEYFCKFVEGDDQVFLHDAIARAITNQVSPLFTAHKEPVPCTT